MPPPACPHRRVSQPKHVPLPHREPSGCRGICLGIARAPASRPAGPQKRRWPLLAGACARVATTRPGGPVQASCRAPAAAPRRARRCRRRPGLRGCHGSRRSWQSGGCCIPSYLFRFRQIGLHSTPNSLHSPAAFCSHYLPNAAPARRESEIFTPTAGMCMPLQRPAAIYKPFPPASSPTSIAPAPVQTCTTTTPSCPC